MSGGKLRVADAPGRLSIVLRDNGLTITLVLLFALAIAAMGLTGWKAHNATLVEHGAAPSA